MVHWKKCSNRPFALRHHFTITTRILQDFAFLCKWGLCYSNLTGITKFKYERKNEKDSGRSSKITPSCKWPITCLQILLRGMGNHVTVHRPTDRASVRTARQPMFNLTLSIRVQPDIAHPCCEQLTAVKTGYPDQYHLIVSRAQVWPTKVEYFLKLSADKLPVFKRSQAQVHFFKNA